MFCTVSMCCWWVFKKSAGGLDRDMIPLTATLHGVTSNQLLAKMIVVSTFSELTRVILVYWMVLVSPQTEFPLSRRFKVEHKSKWRLRPNTDLSPPLAACALFSSVFKPPVSSEDWMLPGTHQPHPTLMSLFPWWWWEEGLVGSQERVPAAQRGLWPRYGSWNRSPNPSGAAPGVVPSRADTNGSRAI